MAEGLSRLVAGRESGIDMAQPFIDHDRRGDQEALGFPEVKSSITSACSRRKCDEKLVLR